MIDLPTLQVIGWVIVGASLLSFALTSGFDSGIGILLPFIGRNDTERRLTLNVIGPTWDGNQVWLIAAGGAVFAIWPLVYSTAFSGYYVAMLLILWSLFLRPVGFEYRSKLPNQTWRNNWDIGIFIASFIPILIMGIAFGNLLLGSPFSYDPVFLRMQYTGSFIDLLSPFALLSGVIAIFMVICHGAAYLNLRTKGIIKTRAQKALRLFAWCYLIAFALAGLLITYKIPGYLLGSQAGSIHDPLINHVNRHVGAWLNNYHTYPWMTLAPVIGFLGAFLAIISTHANRAIWSFVGTSFIQMGTLLTAAFSLFPFIMPSSSEPAHSLTVWNASTSQHTLTIIAIVAVIMVPVIFCYTSFVYIKMWRDGPIHEKDIEKNQHILY
ncbi:cytochrome d ubiquinol oxidase subunit 2 [Piscirickettsia salmonis]|uniref:Cytochrome d ubiquinol oxidase subunit 2 n=1 Tax=Piscirickettsia salmonis TaxID=1238 RepID=A0A9Q6LLV9_PISSA|nr:cytochrome d ubiquinol oxidase subunit II [Piscirickettsia salmonis]ALA25252.1 cytochrome d ubiquinol oxidase, subunit II [Piscirickettsia salmonis]ALA25262.1 cytochrome d ubiquinol oxidase, subunit II [Piscirickettsia salmonis]ALA25271.1 cytochrome d ubiquinol oxidase, subunit II [Piscirickettsia salmonis]ALA25280.1 cytochrome d ubiquinol oxidase, subunit II [Piscirickettsia salmonis]APS45509.1 cytochrome d ubiquinol oxidase subunit 2 [Piscirickettsia salmonis]